MPEIKRENISETCGEDCQCEDCKILFDAFDAIERIGGSGEAVDINRVLAVLAYASGIVLAMIGGKNPEKTIDRLGEFLNDVAHTVNMSNQADDLLIAAEVPSKSNMN